MIKLKYAKLLLFFWLIFSLLNCTGNAKTGKLEFKTINAASLKYNLLFDSAEQKIVVYTPAGYTSGKDYPVLYFLGGYSATPEMILASFKSTADHYFSRQPGKGFIIVGISGANRFNGSFYVNSTVTGRWEDYVVKDVVGYIDGNYKTVPKASARAISGHSMGGFGAINIALRHPDVFSAVYAMSPALLEDSGLPDILGSEIKIKAMADEMENLSKLAAAGKESLETIVTHEMRFHSTPNDLFMFAMGTSFSPDPKQPPYFAFPYKESGCKLVANEGVYNAWQSGMGDALKKIEAYKNRGTRLNGIIMEYGFNDEFSWIPKGIDFYSKVMDANKIPHEVIRFDGGHSDKFNERLLTGVLPYFGSYFNR